MKGIAEITVRGKDGKIKLQRREHNAITTAHVEKIKQAIRYQKYARNTPGTDASDFQGIWLHSEQLENCGDIEPVVLCGGTATRASGVSQDYAPATKSQIEGNDIVNTWVWVLEKSVNIKAMSLHDKAFVDSSGGLGPIINGAVIEQPNKKICKTSYSKRSQYGSWSYVMDGADVEFNMTTLSNYARRTGSTKFLPPLYADDEYMQSNSSAGDTTGHRVTFNSTLSIVDDNGETVRSFSATQFAGLADATTYYCKVMPTAAADWLFVFKSATEVAVYKIPRTASGDAIPLMTTITGTGLTDDTTQIMSNCAVFNANQHSKTMFTAKTDGTYAMQQGVQMVNAQSVYMRPGCWCANRESNPLGATYFGGLPFEYDNGVDDKYKNKYTYISVGFSPLLHNTILNLSEPIEAEAGDTLTINYTVTVNEGAEA